MDQWRSWWLSEEEPEDFAEKEKRHPQLSPRHLPLTLVLNRTFTGKVTQAQKKEEHTNGHFHGSVPAVT